MTKKFLAVSFLSLILVACGGNSDNSNSSSSSSRGALELTEIDKKLANGNVDEAGKILLQKAILQEAKNEKLTEEEQYNLDLAKQEVEVNFYLRKKFDKDFSNVSAVSEEEAKKYYDEHKSEIGNTPFEKIKDEIETYKSQISPAIVLIPGTYGNTGDGVQAVKNFVEQAVGSDILFGND